MHFLGTGKLAYVYCYKLNVSLIHCKKYRVQNKTSKFDIVLKVLGKGWEKIRSVEAFVA